MYRYWSGSHTWSRGLATWGCLKESSSAQTVPFWFSMASYACVRTRRLLSWWTPPGIYFSLFSRRWRQTSPAADTGWWWCEPWCIRPDGNLPLRRIMFKNANYKNQNCTTINRWKRSELCTVGLWQPQRYMTDGQLSLIFFRVEAVEHLFCMYAN